MKIHTTNYFDTFIQVAEDCPVASGEVPPLKGEEKSIATIQFELISENPYQYTSDDILFQCFVLKKSLERDLKGARNQFFSKGQACLRSSPLTKRYGWGIHFNHEGKIALYGKDSDTYKQFSEDKRLKTTKAMRSKKI
jgi:hypothetical protein